jgi:hypothetical protein
VIILIINYFLNPLLLLSFLFLLTKIINPTNPTNRTDDDVIKAIINVCVLELTIVVNPETTYLVDSIEEIDSSIIKLFSSAFREGAIETHTSSPFDNPASLKLVIFLGVPPWLDVYQTSSTSSEILGSFLILDCIDPNLSTPLNVGENVFKAFSNKAC